MAVGQSRAFGTSSTLVEHWNGSTWTIQHSPGPGLASELNDVSCPSARSCFAVGSFNGVDGNPRTLVERWNGSTWRVQKSPNNPYLGGSQLITVSCASARACMAVGTTYNDTQDVVRTYAQRWNGSRWTIERPVSPAGTNSLFIDVSCPAADACTAAGASGATPIEAISDHGATLIERWDGRRWAIQPSPNPRGAVSSKLWSVSCAATNACTAVGDSWHTTRIPGHRSSLTLAERWDGTRWTIQRTASPNSRHRSLLFDVSCASTSRCSAVGRFQRRRTRTLAEHWHRQERGSSGPGRPSRRPTGTAHGFTG
jgi:hypothetical protein